MKYYFINIFFLLGFKINAQYYTMYMDTKHYQAVTENQVVRMASEQILISNSKKVKENLEKINKNYAQVVAIKELIYESLYNVNEYLRNGKELVNIGSLIVEIAGEAKLTLEYAKDNPQFTPFAERSVRNCIFHSQELYQAIKTEVLKMDKHYLMDYNSRDTLLRNITGRLKLLRAEIYLTRHAMYWARQNGLWNSINPFADWINYDKAIMSDIIYNSKTLEEWQ